MNTKIDLNDGRQVKRNTKGDIVAWEIGRDRAGNILWSH